MTESFEENLSIAIIWRASKDYAKALCDLEKNPDNHNASIRKAECIKFFKSDWFLLLSNLKYNPDDFMRLIRLNKYEVAKKALIFKGDNDNET